MLIYYFANLQKLYIFSKIEETYVAKVIKIVAATCALNLPLYDMLKGMYFFLGLFFFLQYTHLGTEILFYQSLKLYKKWFSEMCTINAYNNPKVNIIEKPF